MISYSIVHIVRCYISDRLYIALIVGRLGVQPGPRLCGTITITIRTIITIVLLLLIIIIILLMNNIQ